MIGDVGDVCGAGSLPTGVVFVALCTVDQIDIFTAWDCQTTCVKRGIDDLKPGAWCTQVVGAATVGRIGPIVTLETKKFG